MVSWFLGSFTNAAPEGDRLLFVQMQMPGNGHTIQSTDHLNVLRSPTLFGYSLPTASPLNESVWIVTVNMSSFVSRNKTPFETCCPRIIRGCCSECKSKNPWYCRHCVGEGGMVNHVLLHCHRFCINEAWPQFLPDASMWQRVVDCHEVRRLPLVEC
ncbi:hypothetical protein NEOLEDRAFT_378298 [Neolentinus lepideus HHB14362 ss-1]|uniref:Uncharacterized protein n=1 Tax=Neolentinus lepideus HHB14362 ss-1 TaxID=1314782 RepID=A0A165SBL2_9AGAM|nr:hypothetical protein NEOLEDRAFT_378298 [Neolentinus lepideus HHB14362 ss-1]